MGGGRRRTAGRVCLGAALLCGIVALAAPARAQDDEGFGRPDVFRGAADASVAVFEVEREALLPIPELFRFIALDGQSVYETDLQTARASLLFPGNGLIVGPNLACSTAATFFPPDFAPIFDLCLQYDYPLSVRADASEPSLSTDGSVTIGTPTDPVSADAASARARATADGASTLAAAQDLRVLGLPVFGPVQLLPLQQLDLDTSVLTIESATSRTDQRIVDGALVVESSATLNGVGLIGGLIQIGSIRTTAMASDDATGNRAVDAVMEVTGVTVGGVPARLTEDGLVVGSPSGGTGPLQQQLQTALNQLLSALDIRVSLLDVQEEPDDGTGLAVASAGGVLVEMAVDAAGLPILPGPIGDIDPNGTYVGSILLGQTAASAGAVTFDIEEIPPIDPVAPGAGAPVADVDFGGSEDAVDVPVPEEQTAAPPARGSTPQELVRVFTDPFGGRLAFVYLAFAFAVLALCLAPPFSIPARLPGPSS